MIRDLEKAALEGHTLRPQADLVSALRQREEKPGEQTTPVTGDLLAVAEDELFAGEVRVIKMADDRPAYQIERLAQAGKLIRETIDQRVSPQSQRNKVSGNWRSELDQLLGPLPSETEERKKEERAREEKAAALEEIAASRFSVLVGPAGTGKTTLLSVLCSRSEIYKDKILLLAPTGKARVRMEDVARRAGTQNFEAKTLAQFLCPREGTKRYDPLTQRYFLANKPGAKVGRTVIVDECSMLTEEMMAALIEALSGVHRLIFVGDPRQLPPIGAGRPFADTIAHLQPADIETRFPRVSRGYAELTIPRRQEMIEGGASQPERDDLQLAAWFSGSQLAPGEDRVFEILAGKRKSETVRFVSWQTPDQLKDILPTVLSETLEFPEKLEEWQAFACTLGGNMFGQYVYFNRGRSGKLAEAWQILTPVRQKPWGVDVLNRFIHERYKARQLETARANVPPWQRRILKPCGEQQIVYGDKIINNRNDYVYPSRINPRPESNGYLANGEIGMVVGQIRTAKYNYEPTCLEVEFSTQQNVGFKFYPSDFDDEGEADLELAYALTVHKAQGSEFNVVFLVLPRSPVMLTRELLYTALTRQKQRVVILHQGSAIDLQRLSSEEFSATATRLTNLFGPPKPIALGDKFLEDRLIHRTKRGEAVRSKSEVIIANELHNRKLDYHYEQPLEFDGVVKYPDFTIEDDNTGKTYYWEHCGLLHDPAYAARWADKKNWYARHNILLQKEGGGPNGTLIETRDQPDGGIDSQTIALLIETIFAR